MIEHRGYMFDNWAKAADYWLEQHNYHAHIEPSNDHDAFVGLNHGESANFCWAAYQECIEPDIAFTRIK